MESLQAVQQAWQIANGDYIDVPAFGAGDDGDSLVWDAGSGAFVKATLATSAALAAHIADAANPHGVTAAQVGSYTIANADSAIAAAVSAHAAAADPHTPYLLATGTRAGASSQAQTFTNGIKSPKTIAITDSTNAGGWYKANGTAQDVYYDSTNGRVGIGALPNYPLHVHTTATNTPASFSTNGRTIVNIQGESDNSAEIQMTSNGAAVGTWRFSVTGSTKEFQFTDVVSSTVPIRIQKGAATSSVHISATGNVGIGALSSTAKLSVTGTGHFSDKVLFGHTSTPTAAVDIAASTTAAASLRIRSGTAPTTPNDGDMWFDGTNLKFRAGGVTKTITWT